MFISLLWFLLRGVNRNLKVRIGRRCNAAREPCSHDFAGIPLVGSGPEKTGCRVIIQLFTAE